MSIIKLILLGSLLTAPIISVAGVVDLGTLSSSASFNSADGLSGSFSDTWNFNVNDNAGIGVSATSVAVTFGNMTFGGISDFRAQLDGNDLNWISQSSGSLTVQLLAGGLAGSLAGTHSLVISGIADTNNSSYGGSISVAPVPVPAAVYLMGSSLLGLISFSRRKETLAV